MFKCYTMKVTPDFLTKPTAAEGADLFLSISDSGRVRFLSALTEQEDNITHLAIGSRHLCVRIFSALVRTATGANSSLTRK
jgi:hypothetical protein